MISEPIGGRIQPSTVTIGDKAFTQEEVLRELNATFSAGLQNINSGLMDSSQAMAALRASKILAQAHLASLELVSGVFENLSPGSSMTSRAMQEIQGIAKRETVYAKVVMAAAITAKTTGSRPAIYPITGPLFHEVLEAFPPHQKQDGAAMRLEDIYRVFFHSGSGVLGVANRGVNLFTRSPKRDIPYVTAHDRFMLFFPNHGIETVNVGLVGNVQNGNPPIVRAESACCPSFMFGSQRCNCHDQWMAVKEVAAEHNRIEDPASEWTPRQLEGYLAAFYDRDPSTWAPIPTSKNGPGFIMIHMDTQNGMGAGADEGVYRGNLFDIATIRHGGLYTAEQSGQRSLKGGYQATGLPSHIDLRSLNDDAAFRVPAIILTSYGIKNIIALTNNIGKLRGFEGVGIHYKRVVHLGRVDLGNLEATNDRRNEYSHRIPGTPESVDMVDFFQDLARLNQDLANLGVLS